MKKFNGYDEAKEQATYQGSAKLPKGAYIAKINNVRYEEGQDGNSDRIIVAFDINEGEYKDFFKTQYDANTAEDKRWKGTARIYVPSDDGSEQDGWTKKAFARWTDALEKSNTKYTWDWDEKKWKNKLIGLIFRETGTVIEGREVVYTEVSAPCSTADAKNGTFWDGYLKFKAKNGYTGKASASASNNADIDGFMAIPEGTEEEIPF